MAGTIHEEKAKPDYSHREFGFLFCFFFSASSEVPSVPFWEYSGSAPVAKFLIWQISPPPAFSRTKPFFKAFIIYDEEAFLLLLGIREGVIFLFLEVQKILARDKEMKLLVAVDFSDSSQKIIEYVKELAKVVSGKIWLVHVAEPDLEFVGYEVDPPEMRDIVARRFHKEHQQ